MIPISGLWVGRVDQLYEQVFFYILQNRDECRNLGCLGLNEKLIALTKYNELGVGHCLKITFFNFMLWEWLI